MDFDQELVTAATKGCLDSVKALLMKRTDIHATDRFKSDGTMLWAAINGHLNVIRFLYQNGNNIRINNDCTVRYAACRGHLDVVRFLIENGVDIHAAGWGSPDAAVRQAARNGHLDVVRFLLNPRKYGVDRDGSDRNILVQHHPEVLAQIQQLEQQELYNNARVMYYTLSFAQQNQYGRGSCGALVQALAMSL